MSEAPSGPAPVLAGSSIIDVRMWFDESPWRVAAGWTVLAAGLAAGLNVDAFVAQASTFVLLFVLADPLWGSIWGLMSAPDSLPSLRRSLERSRVWLPYLRSGSPAARLFGMDGPGILVVIYRVALPVIFLALVVSLILHPAALWLTLLLIGISTAGWLHHQVESIPIGILYALVTVALPWLLVVLVLGGETNQTPPLLLAGLWTLHFWATETHSAGGGNQLTLAVIAATHVGLALLLIFLQLPLWLVFLSIFLLPTWLAVYQGQSIQRVRFWWLAAMLTSGLALGQII